MSFNFNLISRHNPSLCNSLQEELMNMLPNFPLMTCQEFADTIDIYLGQRRGNDDLFGPMAEELTNGFGRLQCVHGSAAINMLASPPLYLLEESSNMSASVLSEFENVTANLAENYKASDPRNLNILPFITELM